MNLDLTRAFTYPTRDPEWVKKLLIGAVLLLVPIVNFITIGYYIQCVRNVARGEDDTLPEWTDIGEYFKKGCLMIGVYLAYILPYMVVVGTCGGAVVLGIHNHPPSHSGIPAAIFIPLIIIWCVTIVFCIIFTVALPAIIYRLSIFGTFRAAFDMAAIWHFIRANLGAYIVMLLVDYLAFMVASVGVLACFVGLFFTSVYAYLICSHLLGQLIAAGDTDSAPAL